MNHSGTKTQLIRFINGLPARLRTTLLGYDNTSFRSLLKNALGSLLRTPPKVAFLLCALALILPAAITLLSGSFKAAEENLLQNRQVTVFLHSQVSDSEARQMASALAASNNISVAVLAPVSVGNDEIMTIDLQPSPRLKSDDVEKIVAELNGHTSVEYVAFDSLWMAQNNNAIQTTKKLALLSGVLTVLITLLLTYFISRAELHRQRPECRVMNQMGASRSTLITPVVFGSLLLTSLAICAATLLAWGGICLLLHFVDMSTYGQMIPANFPALKAISLVFLAIAGSILTTKLLGRKFNTY